MERRWWRSPAVATVGYLLLGLLVFAAIAEYAERNATNERFLDSMPFRIWIAFSVASVGLWLALFRRGIVGIRALRGGWCCSRAWWAWNILGYVAALAVVGALLSIAQTAPMGPPVMHWVVLIRLLTVIGAIAAAPWVLLVWLAHEQVRSPTAVVRNESEPAEAGDINSAVAELLAAWKVIQNCALALALGITPAILNTGALRLALIDAAVITKDRFPPYAALAYAVPFAALVAVAIVPLVVRYRSQAVRMIDRALGAPESGVPSQQWVDDRQRLEVRLNIDIGLLRSPITALSLLTPFVTAALAAFVPV